jgi:AcrR family transcriptional regulator
MSDAAPLTVVAAPSRSRRDRPADEALLQAALSVVAREGSRGATTRRIAVAAGVSEVTLFRHFESKEALIVEALERSTRGRQVRRLPAVPRDVAAELANWLRRERGLLRRRGRLMRTCLGEFDAFPKHAMIASRWFSAGVDELRDYLSAVRQAGLSNRRWDPAAVALMLMSALVCDTLGREIMPQTYPQSPQRTLSSYLALIVDAIGLEPV